MTARGGELVELHFQRLPDVSWPRPPVGWVAVDHGGAHAERATPRAKWMAVVGLGSAAVAAAGVGLGFGLASQSQANEVQTLRNEIAPGSAWTGTECTGASGAGLCRQLKSTVDANRQDWTVSAASSIGAGVLGAAAIATWMIWKPKSGIAARPEVGPRSAALVIGGPW